MGGKLMNNNNDSFTMEDRAKLIQARIDSCDGDFSKYLKKYNRHTLSISLTNEQTGSQDWEGTDITFINEDNAIQHLALVSNLLDFLSTEENKVWGTGFADEALVQRATDFIRKQVSPPESFV